MKIRIIVSFTMMFGTVILFVGCGPELITCPDNSGRSAKVGRTESNLLYELGTVVVRYHELRDLTDDVPLAAVNDFFLKRGYTPKVKGSVGSHEYVSIGDDVEIYPMLKDLRNTPGVADVRLHFFLTTSTLLLESAPDYVEGIIWDDEDWDWPSVSRAILEVGVLEDGTLYEFGVVLVKYDEGDTASVAPAIVSSFFTRKGYFPRIINSVYDFKVMHVGDCVDIAPMLETLRAIPGVADVRLNQLHSILEVAQGKFDRTDVSLF